MSQKKTKIGRPKLPKGEAKGRIVPVRFRSEDLKAMDTAARTNSQSISELIRSMVYQLFSANCPRCKESVMANIAMDRGALTKALDGSGDVFLAHAFPLASDHRFLASEDVKDIIRKRIANGLI